MDSFSFSILHNGVIAMFYNLYKTLCEQRELSVSKAAEIIGFDKSTVTSWKKNGTTPSREVLELIADYFEVSLDYLLTGKENTPSDKKGVRIPVLGSVAAGIPIEAIEDVVDWEDIPTEWTRGGYEYFGLKVKGDSMYPEYLDSDTVIVQKQENCESGQDCVVYVNGYDATLKTVKLGEDGSITLQPINPQYPPKTYTKEEVEGIPVIICGIIKELRRTKG